MQFPREKLRSILKSLSDDASVEILLEIRSAPTYSQALSKRLDIAKSTVWKKLSELQATGLIEPYFDTPKGVGRRVKMFKFKDHEMGFARLSDLLDHLSQK